METLLKDVSIHLRPGKELSCSGVPLPDIVMSIPSLETEQAHESEQAKPAPLAVVVPIRALIRALTLSILRLR